MAEGDQERKDVRITGGVRLGDREGARLLVVAGIGIGRKLVIREGLVLGRSSDCELVLDDPELSRRHARFASGEPGTYVVEDLGSRNGTWVNGTRIGAPVKLAFGDRVQVGRTVLQLAPYDRVEEQLLHRQRLETLGRLAAGIAHDFNNMVGAVAASISFLRRLPPEGRGGSDAEECLDDIEAAARRAAELAGRLLSFARSEAEDSGPAAVSDVCHEVAQLARRTFERAIRIEALVEPGLFVHLSSAQLHQVLMNLCLNARDAIVFQKASGRIVVRAVAGGGRDVVITVEDDGCGMDDDTRGRVFEPFFTTKGEGAGFGLGLSTVGDIVRAHGGTISVDSTPGAGSTFTIRLAAGAPVRRGVLTITDVGARPVLGRGDGRRVLLVDDEVVMRRSLTRVLGRAGFDVVSVGDGESALQLLDEDARGADVVLLDLDLPGLSGEETLRLLRRRSVKLPIVCITGHADRQRKNSVLARGASGYLVKPCEPEELVMTLLDAIKNCRETTEDTTEV
jgi:signal transduction histidine kinase/ActR/RegA family two-component response regulator